MTLPDPLAAVRKILLADAELAALVGTEIFVGELPDIYSKSSPPKGAVVIAAAPGTSNQFGCAKLGTNSVDLRSYGTNSTNAHDVGRAVLQVLKFLDRTKTAEGTVLSTSPTNDGLYTRDPNTDWPVWIQSYSILAPQCTS